jgi:hypothetical protein
MFEKISFWTGIIIQAVKFVIVEVFPFGRAIQDAIKKKKIQNNGNERI